MIKEVGKNGHKLFHIMNIQKTTIHLSATFWYQPLITLVSIISLRNLTELNLILCSLVKLVLVKRKTSSLTLERRILRIEKNTQLTTSTFLLPPLWVFCRPTLNHSLINVKVSSMARLTVRKVLYLLMKLTYQKSMNGMISPQTN